MMVTPVIFTRHVVDGVRLDDEASGRGRDLPQEEDRSDGHADERQHHDDAEHRLLLVARRGEPMDRFVDDERTGREDEAALEHRAEALRLGVTVVVVLVGAARRDVDHEEVRERHEEIADRVHRRRDHRHAAGEIADDELRDRADDRAGDGHLDGAELPVRGRRRDRSHVA
jgi:hypothetical protein